VAETRRKYWRKLIAEQQASGQKALAFCREHGISQYSFYKWRQRLRQGAEPQFAVLEVTPAASANPDSALELILRSGERLHIGNQVAAETLRMVLEAVRG
jgi:transposase-like protein